MKQITLDGRIGRDGAKVLTSAKGKPYIRFSLANNTFVNGAEKTEWFEISSFDPFIVESKSKLLTQGRYVIVQGVLNSEVTSKNGNIYLNHYVSANSIELPSFGKREETNEVQVSTYTGGTKSDQAVSKPQPVQEATIPVQQPVVPQPQPQQVVSQSAPAGWNNDDDLPF